MLWPHPKRLCQRGEIPSLDRQNLWTTKNWTKVLHCIVEKCFLQNWILRCKTFKCIVKRFHILKNVTTVSLFNLFWILRLLWISLPIDMAIQCRRLQNLSWKRKNFSGIFHSFNFSACNKLLDLVYIFRSSNSKRISISRLNDRHWWGGQFKCIDNVKTFMTWKYRIHLHFRFHWHRYGDFPILIPNAIYIHIHSFPKCVYAFLKSPFFPCHKNVQESSVKIYVV